MPILVPNEKGEFELHEVDLDNWKTSFGRILLDGPPLSGKTTGFLTFPETRHILIAPMELGHSSIRETDQTKKYWVEFDPSSTTVQYARMWAYIQKITTEILAGKYGKVTTFGLDGLHRIYYMIMKANGYNSNTDPREFGKYHELFNNYLAPILSSKIPFVVATCYDGVEATEAGSKVTSLFPDLPGKMAKHIMGLFPAVFHTERRGLGEKEQYFWQLRTTGKVQGVGMHLPPEVKRIFPGEIEVKFEDGKLVGGWQEIDQLINKQ